MKMNCTIVVIFRGLHLIQHRTGVRLFASSRRLYRAAEARETVSSLNFHSITQYIFMLILLDSSVAQLNPHNCIYFQSNAG